MCYDPNIPIDQQQYIDELYSDDDRLIEDDEDFDFYLEDLNE